MTEPASSDFRARVEAFLAETGMAISDLGRRAMNDGSFVADMREGRDFRSSTMQKVDRFIIEFTKSANAAGASNPSDEQKKTAPGVTGAAHAGFKPGEIKGAAA